MPHIGRVQPKEQIMPVNDGSNENASESFFLNEYFMTAASICAAVTGFSSFVLVSGGGFSYTGFIILIKVITTVFMFFAFRRYEWDAAKGLMGGVLFSIMFGEAYLVLGRLWQEADFDKYLVAGPQGSIYLASAGMSLMMTVIITINHFVINHSNRGKPENVELNRMAMLFKLIVYVILIVSNCMLGFAPVVLWRNSLQYLTDMSVLLILVCVESQFDSFKILRKELLDQMKDGI